MSPEFLEALKLVEEYDRQRPKQLIEYRLYYNDAGEITMYCETDHPSEGNYVVIDHPDVFFKNNTGRLRVINGELKIVDVKIIETWLVKSVTGQPVVRGMAAVALEPSEQYPQIEYYDRTTHN